MSGSNLEIEFWRAGFDFFPKAYSGAKLAERVQKVSVTAISECDPYSLGACSLRPIRVRLRAILPACIHRKSLRAGDGVGTRAAGFHSAGARCLAPGKAFHCPWTQYRDSVTAYWASCSASIYKCTHQRATQHWTIDARGRLHCFGDKQDRTSLNWGKQPDGFVFANPSGVIRACSERAGELM